MDSSNSPLNRVGEPAATPERVVPAKVLASVQRMVSAVDGIQLTLLVWSSDGEAVEEISADRSHHGMHPLCAHVCGGIEHAGKSTPNRLAVLPATRLGKECVRAIRKVMEASSRDDPSADEPQEMSCPANVRYFLYPVRIGKSVICFALVGPFLPKSGRRGLAEALQALAVNRSDLDLAALKRIVRTIPEFTESRHLPLMEGAVAVISQSAVAHREGTRKMKLMESLEGVMRPGGKLSDDPSELSAEDVLKVALSSVTRTAGLRAAFCLIADPLRDCLEVVAASGRAPGEGFSIELDVATPWSLENHAGLCPVASTDSRWSWLHKALAACDTVGLRSDETFFALPLTAGGRPYGLVVYLLPWAPWPSHDWQDRRHCQEYLYEAGEWMLRWTGVLRDREVARDILTMSTHGFRSELQRAVSAVDYLDRVGPSIDRYSHRTLADLRATLCRLGDRTSVERWLLSPKRELSRPKDEAVDVAAVVTDAVESFKFQAAQRNIVIRLDLKTRSVVRVSIEPDLIRLVLMNLIDNAIKYSDAKRHVTVRTGEVRGEILFEVSNVGQGPTREESRRVFDYGFRGSHATSSDSLGTGLGLFIVKKLASLAGGSVNVRSHPLEHEDSNTRLTTFEVRLPLGQDEKKQA